MNRRISRNWLSTSKTRILLTNNNFYIPHSCPVRKKQYLSQFETRQKAISVSVSLAPFDQVAQRFHARRIFVATLNRRAAVQASDSTAFALCWNTAVHNLCWRTVKSLIKAPGVYWTRPIFDKKFHFSKIIFGQLFELSNYCTCLKILLKVQRDWNCTYFCHTCVPYADIHFKGGAFTGGGACIGGGAFIRDSTVKVTVKIITISCTFNFIIIFHPHQERGDY